jgi:GTP-binding protein YchF
VVEFVDIAGLVRGASRGEGLGNQFLSHIREVDAIVEVVRCFTDENIVHVDGNVDPVRDMETIGLELLFADMQTVEKRLDRARKSAKSGEKRFAREVEDLTHILAQLEAGITMRDMDDEDGRLMALGRDMFLLTAKPLLYAVNVSEDQIATPASANPALNPILAQAGGAEVVVVSAAIEEEIAGMDPQESAAFLAELGCSESGLSRLVRAGYRLLGLISFLTAGEKEVRAWTITRGMTAPQAAGKIHTDFERGFIRAEIVPYQTLVDCGSVSAAKEKGQVRSEGRDYVMQDGDVVVFRFSV